MVTLTRHQAVYLGVDTTTIQLSQNSLHRLQRLFASAAYRMRGCFRARRSLRVDNTPLPQFGLKSANYYRYAGIQQTRSYCRIIVLPIRATAPY